MLFAGDDWAEDHHDIELQDEAGRVLVRARLPEGIAGITRLHALIGQFAGPETEPGEVAAGIETVIGTTSSDSDGAATLTPSIADSTEMAGVIMLSPKNSAAPKIPSTASAAFVRRLPRTPRLRIKVISAMIPPSPSLSARITNRT